MKPTRFHCLSLLAACLLPSCDSLKDKALAVLDEKIEETGGEAVTDGENPVDPAVSAAGPQQAVRYLSEADYDSFTALKGHVVVVDFTADWCPPCRKLGPVLEGLANGNDKIVLGKVDVDKNQSISQREKVNGIPDVRIFVNGERVDRFVGAPPAAAARERIESHLGKISSAPPAPKPEPKPQPKPQPKPADSKPPADPPEDKQPDPTIKKMDKDWLPPGIQRK